MLKLVSFGLKKTVIPEKEKFFIKEVFENAKVLDNINLSNGLKFFEIDGESFRNLYILNKEYVYKGEFLAYADEHNYNISRNFVALDGLIGFSIDSKKMFNSFYNNSDTRGVLKV